MDIDKRRAERDLLGIEPKQYDEAVDNLLNGFFTRDFKNYYRISKLKNKDLRIRIFLFENNGKPEKSPLYAEALRLMKIEAKKRNLKI